MAEEKNFCTLLSELIIDERKAVEAYKLLLDLFEEEKELLTHDVPKEARNIMEELFKVTIKDVLYDEEKHLKIVEGYRKGFCEVREK